MGNRAAKTQVKADQPRLRHYEIPPEECLLGELPDEICIRIFKQLNMRELIWLQSCCLRFAQLARDNMLWLPFCRKHVVDREGALPLALRRKAAALEAAIAAEQNRKEQEKGNGTENEDLDELGGGWVIMGKEEAPQLTGRAKEREEMRRAAEAKSHAKQPRKLIDTITTKWWEQFTPEEEELEMRRGPYEKPLWKEAFIAWKIARDLKIMLHMRELQCLFLSERHHPKACQYHPGDKKDNPIICGRGLKESTYSCCGGVICSWGCRIEAHKSVFGLVGLSEFVEE